DWFCRFETIEAAESCITALRKYKTLHPTFSKVCCWPFYYASCVYRRCCYSRSIRYRGRDTHTPRAPLSRMTPTSLQMCTWKGMFMEVPRARCTDDMAVCRLPLTIDEQSLSTLVGFLGLFTSFYPITHPPRHCFSIITISLRFFPSYFRHTRAGAEEIIERLHGRMVRGWNDPGSRISVRFADTSEQRELRVRDATIVPSSPCSNSFDLYSGQNAHQKKGKCLLDG
ncbi:hypothetical protein BDQ17DRAFT_1364633, partial [Cyathus striatus]